jgi:phenylalanyl-tRNA synthetase alpha chain
MDTQKVDQIRQNFADEVKMVDSMAAVEEIKNKYLSKKGIMTELFSGISEISAEERKEFGAKVNGLKREIEEKIKSLEDKYKNQKLKGNEEKLLATLPGIKPEVGHTNIITQAINEIVEIFKPLGFSRVRYPEIEWEYFAFEALNIPETHPARDEWETFFMDTKEDKKYGRMVITPHTSSGQVREMLKGEMPIKMLNISRCGRRQIDINHIPTFFQFEGLVVDKGINISHLKGVLTYFAKNFFGQDRQIRLRPYDFRFTEPSFEIDVNCGLCHGKGCRFCKEGWVELGGAGMVHPNVLKAGKIDPNIYSGFAFGWGVERTYMMKSGTKIDDIRHLFNNDLEFLEQF